MGPEYWLLSGIAAAATLLGVGLWVGYSLGHAVGYRDVPLLEHELEDLAAQLAEALAQGEAGVAAAQIVVDGARRRAAARADARSPRERHRLLLGRDAGGDAAPGAPAGAADGPTA